MIRTWAGGAPGASALFSSSTRRTVEVVGFVASWIALGIWLHLDPNAYLVVGVPLGWAFQRYVARAPLCAAWVRDAPPFRFDARTLVLALIVGMGPASHLLGAHGASSVAWVIAGMGGAVGCAYALRHVPKEHAGRFALGALATALPGLALVVSLAAVRHFLLHMPWPSGGAASWTFARSLAGYLPICFALEEVVFRGVLDAHLAPSGRGLGSAVVVSVLWGLWHLPVAMGHGHLLLVSVSLVVVHVIVGLGMSWSFRWSRTLLVPAFAHALIDAVRNALLGG